MNAFIDPPQSIPFYLRLGLWAVKRASGRDLLPARLLAWYPRAAISSGVLEALIAHDEPGVGERLLKLVRMQTSFIVACPFCIDMNSFEAEKFNVTAEEIAALQGRSDPHAVATFSARERTAVEYARLISQTPLSFSSDFVAQLTAEFRPREIVILATTVAQVNYWARLIQAMGVPPVGFTAECAT